MAITKIKIPELFNLQSNNTQGTQLPVMTKAQRIAMTGMSNGELIFNSTTDSVEYYDAGVPAWYKIDYVIPPPPAAPTNMKLLIDAGNTSSYSGSGSAWTDIAPTYSGGTANNVSITNLADFQWDSSGYFTTNVATPAYARTASTIAVNSSSATLGFKLNLSSANNTAQNKYLFTDSNAANSFNGCFLIFVNSSGIHIYVFNTSSQYNNLGPYSLGSLGMSYNASYHCHVTYNNGTVKWYTDGVLKKTQALSFYGQAALSVLQVNGYQPDGSSTFYPGQDIYFVTVWNTPLTQVQVDQDVAFML